MSSIGTRSSARSASRWLHTGGIFCALSETTPLVAEEAMAAARRHGTLISYDLNYRDSLWKSIGGQAKARDVNRRLAPYIDVMLGNEEDFSAALGFEIEGVDEHLSELDPAKFTQMIETAVAAYPNFKVVATTLRNATTATINDWGAIAWVDGAFYTAPNRERARDLGPGRRRRFVCLRPHLRAAGGQGPAVRRRVRRRPRRAGHDHPRRHQHGHPGRGRAGDEGRHRPRFPIAIQLAGANQLDSRLRDLPVYNLQISCAVISRRRASPPSAPADPARR